MKYQPCKNDSVQHELSIWIHSVSHCSALMLKPSGAAPPSVVRPVIYHWGHVVSRERQRERDQTSPSFNLVYLLCFRLLVKSVLVMNVRRSPQPNRGLGWVFVERWKEMFAAQFMQAVMTHWLIVLIPTQQASANLWPTISTQSSHGSEQWTSALGNLWPLVAKQCKTSVSDCHSCIQSCLPSLNYLYLEHFLSGLSFSSVTLKTLVWCIVFRFGRKGRSRAFSFLKVRWFHQQQIYTSQADGRVDVLIYWSTFVDNLL